MPIKLSKKGREKRAEARAAAIKASRPVPTVRSRMHTGGIPEQLLKLIESGAKLSVEDLADRFDVSYGEITSILCHLRKKGFMFHPVGGSTTRKNGKFIRTSGLVCDISKNEADLLEVQERYDKGIDAQLTTSFRVLETAWTQFPALRDKIETSLNMMTVKMIGHKEQIKKLAKG